MRKVMTIIYMDKGMRLKAPTNSGQENDWKTWWSVKAKTRGCLRRLLRLLFVG